VPDPALPAKLTPAYGLGCKRPSFSNDYLRAFNRENVELVTTGIQEITPTGVRTNDGTRHDADTLILATGFKVWDRGNMPPFTTRGSHGLDLETWWNDNRFRTYRGVSVAGFPNLHTILAPYGYNGTSFFQLMLRRRPHPPRQQHRSPLERRALQPHRLPIHHPDTGGAENDQNPHHHTQPAPTHTTGCRTPRDGYTQVTPPRTTSHPLPRRHQLHQGQHLRQLKGTDVLWPGPGNGKPTTPFGVRTTAGPARHRWFEQPGFAVLY
jgi:hypothetical protein